MEAREARERADAQTALARSAAAQLAQSEAAVDRADAKVTSRSYPLRHTMRKLPIADATRQS